MQKRRDLKAATLPEHESEREITSTDIDADFTSTGLTITVPAVEGLISADSLSA